VLRGDVLALLSVMPYVLEVSGVNQQQKGDQTMAETEKFLGLLLSGIALLEWQNLGERDHQPQRDRILERNCPLRPPTTRSISALLVSKKGAPPESWLDVEKSH